MQQQIVCQWFYQSIISKIVFFYNNVVQKLKLNKTHITVPRQQYCELTGENENPIQ